MGRYWSGYQWRNHSEPVDAADVVDDEENPFSQVLRSVPMPVADVQEISHVCEACSATFVGYHSEDQCIANLMRGDSESAESTESTDDQYVGAEK